MTEEFMLHETDAAIMILDWLHKTASSESRGRLKMMFRPNVLNWLDRMSKRDRR